MNKDTKDEKAAAHAQPDNPAAQEQSKVGKLPPGVDPKALTAKMAAGLTREQAIEAIEKQNEHDDTDPHDPLPAKKKSDKNEKGGVATTKKETPEDLEAMTIPELEKLADKKHVVLTSTMNKAEIIQAIEAAD